MIIETHNKILYRDMYDNRENSILYRDIHDHQCFIRGGGGGGAPSQKI